MTAVTTNVAGLPCQEKKYLAAGLGEEFSLDSPFHRTVQEKATRSHEEVGIWGVARVY